MTARRIAAPAAALLVLGLGGTGQVGSAAAISAPATVEVPAGTAVTDWAVVDRDRDGLGDARRRQVKAPTVVVGEVSARGPLSRELITVELTEDAQDAVSDGARVVLRVPVARARAMAGQTLSVVAWSGAATGGSSRPDYERPGPGEAQLPGPVTDGASLAFDVSAEVAQLGPGPVTFRVGLAGSPPKDRRRTYVTLRTVESRVAGPALVLLVPDELLDAYGPDEDTADGSDDEGDETVDDSDGAASESAGESTGDDIG